MLKQLIIGSALLALASCTQNAPQVDEVPVSEPLALEEPDFERNDYADMANWLCHPDKPSDSCAVDLTSTTIAADGTTTVVPFVPVAEPAFDCFYIYPTVSFDVTPNSDMTPGPEELNVIANQFARYGAACRLFAPMYRQTTLLELRNQLTTGKTVANDAMRYADVIDSWNAYLSEHNNGRGVLLVGHSQGSGMIYEMLGKDIVGSPAQEQLVGVHAIGFPTTIDPDTSKASGLPVCQSASETGCLVSFESFRSTAPPSVDSFFGVANGNQRAVCTNPAGLLGNDGKLNAFMPRQSLGRLTSNDYGVEVDTPFVSLPGLLTAKCESNATHDWLAISIHTDPSDLRANDIIGDVVINGTVLADWGLHLVDMNLAMGDLVSLAATQGEAWQGAQDTE